MTVKTFAALVADGQLRFQESLLDLEGQKVLVTLVPTPDPRLTEPADEPCAPDWMSVEEDAVFRMPFHWEPVQAETMDAGVIRPSAIVPEDLPNE
ncbi:MAG: hypothetical protein GXY83_33665 [Rhodopirellula sp.]|nr:hypothetical protein [Rhodopirellula sp.]